MFALNELSKRQAMNDLNAIQKKAISCCCFAFKSAKTSSSSGVKSFLRLRYSISLFASSALLRYFFPSSGVRCPFKA
jgi:hypothetical protein